MSGKNSRVNFLDGMLTPFTKMTELEKIDAGGFGEVYRAEHVDWGTVAYKKLPQSFIQSNDRTVKQMVREVHILKELRHPNIVTIAGVVFEEGNYGIVLEFMPLGNVDRFLQDFKVSLSLKVKLVHDVVLGMNYLHNRNAPIIHGDLKIQNILVTDGYHGKISDFGLSKWKEMSKTSTKRTSVSGTVTHISPERWTDINMDPTETEDVYAFAVLLWEMFTEHKPFSTLDPNAIMSAVRDGQRPDIRRLSDDLPPLLRSTIETSWAANPDERRSFKDIKLALDEYISCHATEMESARSNVQRQDSGEFYPSSDGRFSRRTVDTNRNLPIQRRDTETAQTTGQRETGLVISGNPPLSGSRGADGNDVLTQHPVLPPARSGPNQMAPCDPALTSVSPSLCLDDARSRANPLANSVTVFPIQESAERASADTTTFDPRVHRGQGFVSLRSEPGSLAASGRDFTDGSETRAKEPVGELTRSLRTPATAEGLDSFQTLVSIRSNAPIILSGDRGALEAQGPLELRSDRDSGRERGFQMPGSHVFRLERERPRIGPNEPRSLLEADATLAPESENRALRSDEGRSNSLPCRQPDRENAVDKNNVSMKSVFDNWNKNTDYNNLGAVEGYYPKDGSSFKEHKAQLLPNIRNIDIGTGNNEPTGVHCRHQPPRQGQEQTGRLPGSPRSSHRVPPENTCNGCGKEGPGIAANSTFMTLKDDGKEIIVHSSNGFGPYVQFGNNNTMNITTSARPLTSSASSSSTRGQPGSSARPKGSTKKEKITVPDRLVDGAVLLTVAEGVGRDWSRLARHLDVRDSDVGSYDVDYRHLGVQEVAYQMLRGWVEMKGPEAKMEPLARALVAVGRPDLAKRLSSCGAPKQQRKV